MKIDAIGIAMLAFFAAFAPSVAASADEIRIPIAGNPPEGWEVKEWNGKAGYSVEETEIGKALHLKSDGTSTALHREVSFDIQSRRFLNWKWKVVKLPRGADVRDKSLDDQAAQVYVVFPKWPAAVNSNLIGYIWDSGAPDGAVVTSRKYSKIKYFVIKSGDKGLGQWFAEKRNVYEDYKAAFNEEPPPVGKISVQIDSDDTKTTGESYVGDIYFSSN